MKTNLLSLKIAALAIGIFLSNGAQAQFTAVSSGNWSDGSTWGGTAPTATVTAQNITIPSGISVTLDADVTFSGLLNTFQVNGTLTSTSSNEVVMTQGALTGAGNISIGKLKFTGLATTTFGGTLNVKRMSNTIASLAFTSIANISDTLDLENGSILLNTNSNLSMLAGSTVKVGDGSLVVNAGVFNSGNAYNVMYVGTTKTAGIELNTVTLQNLYLNLNNNVQTVYLNSNCTVNSNLNLQSGMLSLDGHKLILKGDIQTNGGASINSNFVSTIQIEGTGAMNGSLVFASGSFVKELSIMRLNSGQIKLNSQLNISNNLNLMEGALSIENGGNLTMEALSTIKVEKGSVSLNGGTFNGTAAYNVEYTGVSDITSGIETSGSGLTNLMVNYSSGTNKVSLGNNVTVAGKFELMKGKIDMNGKNLVLNGTISQNANSWIIGNTASELALNLTSVTQDTLLFDNANASSQTLSKLRVNITGTNSIILGSKLMISNELSFIAGKIELANSDLEIMSSASIQGFDHTKYIVTSNTTSGALVQNVNASGPYVTFPIGLSTNYSPAYVQQTATGTTGNFKVRCETLYPNLSLKAVNRTWLVEGSGVTTINANLKFAWAASDELNGFDRTNAYVSHYTSSAWDVTAASSATLGVNSTYEMSRMGLTSLSPFAVVENGQPLAIKEVSKLEGVELYPNPSRDVLNIKVLNGNYAYELVDLTGRVVLTATNNNNVNKFDVSGLNSGCYFIKITNLDENKTDTKRFIKQ